jgi:hypothetical protein
MAKQKNNNNSNRPRRDVAPPSPFDQARDEMFQHVMQCGVIGADPAHQGEWFDETMSYLSERFHELTPTQITELRTLGERFAQPAKGSTPPARPADAASAA